MKSRVSKWFYMLGILVFGGVLVLLAGKTTQASAEGFFPPETLEGTWQVQVGQVNCQTGAAMGPAFPSYLSFFGNGTMAENTSNPGFAIGQRAPGMGIWHRSGQDSYYAKSVAFILYSTPGSGTVPPFSAGTQTITQTITFHHSFNQFSADAAIEFADNTGTVYRQGCAVATGTRFK
ncbi:MAG TPA: hypothetical protein VGF44_09925 [Terriglobales bacterium]